MNIREKIITHYRNNPGVTPNYKTLGTDYYEAHPVYEQLFAEGIIENRIVLSPTGRKIKKIFLVESN
jgi:hypothetical protein